MSRLGMFFALFLCALILMPVIPTSAAGSSQSYTLVEEGTEQLTFEEWNVRWEKYDANPNSSVDTWCRQMHNAHSGLRAAYCARQGYNSHYLNSSGNQPLNVNLTGLSPSISQSLYVQRYDTNQDSIMRRELVGAKYYGTVNLSFWFYSDTGASDARQPLSGEEQGYDFLNVIYYTGSSNNLTKHLLWTDTEAQAFAKSWIEVSVSVPNTATWIGFEFVSGTTPPSGGDAPNAFSAEGIRTVPAGSSGMKEGVYLDDISVVGEDPSPGAPLATHADPLVTFKGDRSFYVNVTDNDPDVPLQYVYLFYRYSEKEGSAVTDWAKYTTAEKPQGAFFDRSIIFNAPQDGIYEFFTQGTDANDELESWRGEADAWTMVDTAPPVSVMDVQGSTIPGGYDASVTFTLRGTDTNSGLDKISYRVDDTYWVDYTSSVGLATSGDHKVDFFAIDKAGNTETVRTSTVSILNGGNGITFQNSNDTYPNGDVSINFTIEAPSSISKLEYSLDNGPYVGLDPLTTSIHLDGLGSGDHHLTVRAEDSLNDVIVNELAFAVGEDGNYNDTKDAGDNTLPLVGIGLIALAGIGGALYLFRRKKE